MFQDHVHLVAFKGFVNIYITLSGPLEVYPSVAYFLVSKSLHIVKDVVVVFREAFSHDPSIHPYKEENPSTNKYPPPPPPPSAHVSLSRKGMLGPKGGTPICNDNQQESRSDIEQCWGIFAVFDFLPWSAVCCYLTCCYLTGHKQCKHQDFQRPGSQ
jgi:hypothetical protein